MKGLPYVPGFMVFLAVGQAMIAQPSQPPSPLPDSEAKDAYAVYAALIRKTVGTRESSRVLILDHTNGGPRDATCLKAPEGKDAAQYGELIRAFLQMNKVTYQLLPRFEIGRPYDLVSSAPRLSFDRTAAHFSMSAVGFSTARDRAVVHMAYGGMAAAYFLTKVDGRWTVDFQRMPFVCGATA